MRGYLSLFSILIFIATFLGGGFYLKSHGVEDAFYVISPTVAIIPALIWGLLVSQGRFSEKINHLISGMADPMLLSMCLIFILAGAFGVVTQAVGCIDDLVSFLLNFLPTNALLPGLFILSALVSFAMGSSMGVVAAITPIGLGFSQETGLSLPLCLGIVVGGAMFGDNLSLISDTSIAATQTQKTTPQKKFKLNAPIAVIAAAIYVVWVYVDQPQATMTVSPEFSVLKLLPYGVVILLAILGMNVFGVLGIGIFIAGLVGIFDHSDYSLLTFTQDIYKGFSSMNEIMVLSLLVGGLIGLVKSQGGLDSILKIIQKRISGHRHSGAYVEVVICLLICFVTAAVANNVISVLLVGPIAKQLISKYNVKAVHSATWLSVFSCCIQGVLPYGAQVLLASRLGHVSPLEVTSNVGYCIVLAIVGLLFLMLSARFSLSRKP